MIQLANEQSFCSNCKTILLSHGGFNFSRMLKLRQVTVPRLDNDTAEQVTQWSCLTTTTSRCRLQLSGALVAEGRRLDDKTHSATGGGVMAEQCIPR